MQIPFSDDLIARLIAYLSELPKGERLPSERALAEQLGASRTALRDRLMRLEAIGAIERRIGSGTYLRELSSATASDTFAMGMVASNLDPGSMVPVRIALEREAARQAAMRTDHINLAHMAAAVDDMTPEAGDKALRAADHRFHTALIAASGVSGLVFFAEILRDILWATIREIPLVERQSEMQPIHRAISDAVRAQDPVAAMAAVDAHFVWLEAMIEQGTFDSDKRAG